MTDFPQSPDQFLTAEECAEVDQALMTSRDRFTTRVAIYSLRALKQMAQQFGVPISSLTEQQVVEWVEQDPSLSADKGFDTSFKRFFARLVLSSLRPLRQIATEDGVAIEALTLPQVVRWFEKESKVRVEQGDEATFLQ